MKNMCSNLSAQHEIQVSLLGTSIDRLQIELDSTDLSSLALFVMFSLSIVTEETDSTVGAALYADTPCRNSWV